MSKKDLNTRALSILENFLQVALKGSWVKKFTLPFHKNEAEKVILSFNEIHEDWFMRVDFKHKGPSYSCPVGYVHPLVLEEVISFLEDGGESHIRFSEQISED